MKRYSMIFAMIMLVALMMTGCSDKSTFAPAAETATTQALEPMPQMGTPIEGQYIVVFKNEILPLRSSKSVVEQTAKAALSASNISPKSVDKVYNTVLSGFSAKISAVEAARLAKDNRIAYIEQDQVVTLFGRPGGGGGGGAQQVPWGIQRIGGAGNGVGRTAWIIDTGIDLTHPDLNVDLTRAFTAFTSGADATPNDLNGHGSHVAGTVAAIDNSIGVVGVAAGATVVPVKVLDRRGSGTWTGVIAGMDYVAANAANGDAANMSLGGGISAAVDQATLNMAQAGVKVAIAAGNESQHANNSSPARVNHTNIYTVSAIGTGDVFASFSNYGNPPVDFAAPGVNIYSCYKGGAYTTMSGTSMASPHVCGILTLGNVGSDGNAVSDPDGNADPIAHR